MDRLSTLWEETEEDYLELVKDWIDPYPTPQLIEHDGVLVVRDDLLNAGSKVRFVDKLIGIAKDDTLANRRNCIRLLGNTDAVRKLFNEVAPGMHAKSSGYTRIVKYKKRLGDRAQLAIIELIE